MTTTLLSDDNDYLIHLLNGLKDFNVDNNIIATIKDTINKRLEECQVELEEFQESSRELEQELEKQLNLTEKRNKDLELNNIRLLNENENLKMKLYQITTDTTKQIQELQKNLNESQTQNEHLTRCIRELEQSNDDLERAKRALVASLEDFESRLNHQIERNVLLENELGEKEELEVIVQRLKDEARDLRCELMVQQQSTNTHNDLVRTNSKTANIINNNNNILNNNGNKIFNKPSIENINEINNSPICTPNNKQQQLNRLNYLQSFKNQTPTNTTTNNNNNEKLPLLSPSTRISALNIVSDLLRKVGALESKLATCRNLVPPGTPKNKSTITSPLNSPNTYKDVNREFLSKE